MRREPDPPQRFGEVRSQMELLVDRDGVALIDADGYLVGLPSDEPLARTLSAGRSGTRDL